MQQYFLSWGTDETSGSKRDVVEGILKPTLKENSPVIEENVSTKGQADETHMEELILIETNIDDQRKKLL